MTRPSAVKKLLDRKESKLTGLIDIDRQITAAQQRLVSLIEEQRSATTPPWPPAGPPTSSPNWVCAAAAGSITSSTG